MPILTKPTKIELEGEYSEWTLKLDQTIPGSGGNYAHFVKVANDGSLIADETYYIFLVKLDGTAVKVCSTGSNPTGNQLIDSSITGKYKVLLDADSNDLRIYKDNVELDTIAIDLTTKFTAMNRLIVGISPNGKYVALVGQDITDTGVNRVQVYEGS
jgi:hypothetical protein